MTLRKRILLAVISVYILIALPAMIILFERMDSTILENAEAVNQSYIEEEVAAADTILSALMETAAWIQENETVKSALSEKGSLQGNYTAASKVLRAQEAVTSYISGSVLYPYINKIVIFNDRDISFIISRIANGRLEDRDNVINNSRFGEITFTPARSIVVLPGYSINSTEPVVAAYTAVGNLGWAYIEITPSFIGKDGNDSTLLFSLAYENWRIPATPDDAGKYTVTEYPLFVPGMKLLVYEDQTELRLDNTSRLIIFLGIAAGALLLAILLAMLLTLIITKPVAALLAHINHISKTKDLTPDPDIEKGSSEIAEIGRAINTMSLELEQAMEDNRRLYEEQKNMEINLLQMQVNPHFLYNTLESIRFLAKLQKAEGIASMARGLSNLLKNIAKNVNDHIPLSEELELLENYNEIQQVRYMGMYELIVSIPDELMSCRVLKFTLQPIVENAIFHGIEPTGRGGTITVKAYVDEKYLYITVHDNGCGMSKEKIDQVLSGTIKGEKLTKVGIRNADMRLKLTYGAECGITMESEEGSYTLTTVKLLLERNDV